jgi:hypothetical protein
MKDIIFTLDFGAEWIDKSFYPVPATKKVPQWYKDMETSKSSGKDNFAVRETQTIKRCMPVFDAITAGYLLILYTDLYVKKEEDGSMSFNWAFDTTETVSFHDGFQLVNYRNLDMSKGAPKLKQPWGIKTPKGYSTLFIPPMHHPKCGITILEGLVDTDGYTNSVQLPFMVDDGFEGTIPAGTPIAQVIPFKRDEFKMQIGQLKEREENNAVSKLLRSTWINGYRNRWRAHKTYQ